MYHFESIVCSDDVHLIAVQIFKYREASTSSIQFCGYMLAFVVGIRDDNMRKVLLYSCM